MASRVRVVSFNDAINYTVHYQNLSLMNRHNYHHYVYHLITSDQRNFHEETQHSFVTGICTTALHTTRIHYPRRILEQGRDRVRKCCSGAIVGIWLYPETLSAGDEELLTKRAGECILPGACPAPCTCNGATVDCSNKRLTAIPKDLPLYTSTL